VENFGLCKKDGDVAVGVCGSVVLIVVPLSCTVPSSSKTSAGIAPAGAGGKVKFQPSTRVVVERCFRVFA